MKPSLSHLLILSMSLFCLSSLAADTSPKMTMENKKPTQDCQKANNAHRVEIKHIEAKGIGYNQGYTSFDAFFTGLAGSYVPFLDVRAHMFNNGKWAVNTGIGARYILDPCHWMVGANVYYDYRRADHDTNLSQVGAGVEAFYDHFEARINGYLPFGDKRKRIKTHVDAVTFKGFSGNNILINEYYNNTYQGAMKGFNAEVGAHLCGNRKQYDLFLGVGPYYYNVSGNDSWGAKARLKAEVTKYLFFEISDSYDWIFHNRFQGSINLSVPFGRRYCYPNKTKQPCHNVMDWQAVLPVERQEIIVVSKFKKKKTIDPVAIDPTTGQPFYVVFVNNINPNLGNGTFENPYQNLTTNDNATSAQSGSSSGNTIYVFAGDNSATHMSGGNMTLLANQRLLGSGNSHQYQTTKGLLTIPAQTLTYPQIAGTGNNVVVLGNNNEVSGFNVTVPSGFTGVDSNTITGANVNFNNFTGGISAIALGSSPATPVFGTILANNNTATTQSGGNVLIYQFGIENAALTVTNNLGQNSSGSANTGLSVSLLTSDNKSTVLINSNTFQNLAGTSLATGMSIFDATVPGSDSIVVTNNTVNNAIRGFTMSTTSPGGSAFIVDGNSVTNTTQTATISTTSSGVACLRFNANTGYPSQIATPFAITGSGGVLSYEPLTNNYPTPTPTGNVAQVPACTCAPCP